MLLHVWIVQEATRFSATWKGRMYNILGYAFSAYCLYRMVMSSINIIFDRDPTKDPVTRGFEVRCASTSCIFPALVWLWAHMRHSAPRTHTSTLRWCVYR